MRGRRFYTYISLSVDGCLTYKKQTWLGFCRLLRSSDTSEVVLDVSRFEYITDMGEAEDVVHAEIEKEFSSIKYEVEQNNKSFLVSLVTDSASCNVGAKKKLEMKFPHIVLIACYCHQLNLMAVNLLSHQSTKEALLTSRAIRGLSLQNFPNSPQCNEVTTTRPLQSTQLCGLLHYNSSQYF